jgi:hypothetical protein
VGTGRATIAATATTTATRLARIPSYLLATGRFFNKKARLRALGGKT